jgi:hypothetical protein
MTTHKCTFCPKPASTTVLAVGPNGRRSYPACEKCKAERTPAPKANAYTVQKYSGGWYIILNGNLEHPFDFDISTEAAANKLAASLNAAMDDKLERAGFGSDRRKVTA